MKLRTATIDDLKILEFWDTQSHVREAVPDDYWNWPYELRRNPGWRKQLIAEVDGHPVGFIQIIDPALEETHYWGQIAKNKRAIDIWIGEERNLNRGYGKQMMRLALEECFADAEVDEVLIDPLESNERAIRFYKRLGFRFVEKRTFSGDKCEVYSIDRKTWVSLEALD